MLEPKPEARPDEMETHLNEVRRLTAILNAETENARKGGPPLISDVVFSRFQALTDAARKAKAAAEKSGMPEKVLLVLHAERAAGEAITNTSGVPWAWSTTPEPTTPEPTTRVIRIPASKLPATHEDKGRRYEFHGCESRPGEPTYEDLLKAETLTQIMGGNWRVISSFDLGAVNDERLAGATQIIVCKFRIANATPEIFAFSLNDKGNSRHWKLFDDRGETYYPSNVLRDPSQYLEETPLRRYNLVPNKPFDLWVVFARRHDDIPIGDKSIAQLEVPLELRMPEYEEIVLKFLGPIALTPGQGSLRW